MKTHALLAAAAAFFNLIAPSPNASAAIDGTTLVDTVDLSPGADAFQPLLTALNHTTHKLYVVGGGNGFQNYAVKVIDTNTNQAVAGIDLGKYTVGNFSPRVYPEAIALDETSAGNKIFIAAIDANGSAAPFVRIIDGQTNTNVTNQSTDIPLPFRGSAMAYNPSNAKLYVLGSTGSIAVVNVPGRTVLKSFNAGLGGSPPFTIVNPVPTRVLAFAANGAALIDSSSDTSSPLTLTFTASAAACDFTTGRVYVSGTDKTTGAPGFFILNGATGALITSRMGIPSGNTVAVGSSSHTVYLSDGQNVLALDSNDLSTKASLAQRAGQLQFDTPNGNELLFIDQSVRNIVGSLRFSDGSLTRIAVAYTPGMLAVNSKTNRVYVADRQTPEMLVLDSSTHAVLDRVFAGSGNPRLEFYFNYAERRIAVSEMLNRVYLSRTSQNGEGIVDIFDGGTDQLLQTVKIGEFGDTPFIAVDDTHHRWFANGTSSGTTGLFIYDLDTNGFIAKVNLPESCNGLSVNPANGRVYVSGASNLRSVQIIDGLTATIVKVVNAGEPYLSAVNKKTGKAFVVKAPNSVSVVNGATDSVETSFTNTALNQFGDNVGNVSVDEVTNTVYVLDQANGNGLIGYLTAFDANGGYAFLGQVDLGRYPTGIGLNAANRQIFVSNDNSGTVSVLQISAHAEAVVGQHFAYHTPTGVFGPGATVTYSGNLPTGFALDSKTGVISGVAPAGSETTTPILVTINVTDGTNTVGLVLSLTISDGVPVFTVNGSGTPSANVTDKVLAFVAKYPGALAGRVLNVQATTTPNDEASWQKLANGTNGYMSPDPSSGPYTYVVNSTSYPAVNGVYFRAKLSARGHPPDLGSNVVGPFNLASSVPRAPQTLFSVKRNGLRADFDFRATEIAAPAGTSVRVQSSMSPSNEGSWSDLTDAKTGHMTQGSDANHFSLLINKYPSAGSVYFRAVASVSGSVYSISNLIGPYTITADTPPVVAITSPSGAGSDADHPLVIRMGSNGSANFNISANASSSRIISSLSILFDGATITKRTGGSTAVSVDYQTSVSGDHIIEALAVDDLGATARGGTGPLYVRVLPAPKTDMRAVLAAGGASNANAASGANSFHLVTDGGNWTDSNTWADLNGNHGVPGLFDLAIIENFSVKVNIDSAVGNVVLRSGRVIGTGHLLLVREFMMIYAGAIEDNLLLSIGQGANCVMVNNVDFPFNGEVDNNGTFRLKGRGGITGLAKFGNHGVTNFVMPLILPPPVGLDPAPDQRVIRVPNIVNTGLLTSGGNFISDSGSTLISQDGGTLITNDGGTLVSENGAGLVGNSGGTFVATVQAEANASNRFAATAASGFTQTSGQTDLNAIQIVGLVAINGGVLSGSGLIQGDLTINGGFLAPGHSPGLIAVTGNYTQGSGGTLIIEAAGGEANQSDQLQIGGSATLGGRLDVRTINGYVPLPNDPFVPIGYSSVVGSFSSVSGNVSLTQTSTGPLVTIDATKPNPSTGQPLNIATRMKVLTNDNVLIAGFIVTGPSGSTKKVLIRGLGPSLAQFGVAGTLSDPFLELHKPDGSVVSNDNWQQGDTSQIPNGFAPSDPREAVLVATLTPGNYSAVVKGAHGETGIGIAELYDLDSASAAKLVNISTRGFINTGDDVMIGGFIIGGNEPAKILVRAIGPTLTDFGVQGALADPTLELHDSNGSTISNDDWRETQESEIIATTIPPNKDREPAILATLVPGNYTAVVRGKNNTTGVGLVEAYNLQ